MANIATTKSVNSVFKHGGFLYWVPWDEDKSIDEVYVAELASKAEAGDLAITVDQVTAFPATGSIYMADETGGVLAYSAVTGTAITLATLTADHAIGTIVEVVQATGATVTSYNGFSCMGYSAETEFNPGIGDSETIMTENGFAITGFSSPAEPTLSVTFLQSDFDSLAMILQKDIEASTENGASVIESTSTFRDIAAIYVARSQAPDGTEKTFVFKFPHLQRNGAEPVVFNNEVRQTTVSFRALYDKTDGYEYKVLCEE